MTTNVRIGKLTVGKTGRMLATIVGAAGMAWAALAAPVAMAQDAKPAQEVKQEASKLPPATRSVWNATDDEVRLEVVTRTLTPPGGKGPKVLLVGAVHVAEGAYYDELQKTLDEAEVVLFEGVKPSGVGDLPPKEDAQACIAMTKSHLTLGGAIIGKIKAKTGSYPASREEVLEQATWPASDVVKSILVDGWGRELVYVAPVAPAGGEAAMFDLVSLGADGKAGGEGADADLKFSEQPKGKEGSGSNIQLQLAQALGLEYQLERIKYDRKHFRNSDLSIDEVEKRLKAVGGDEDSVLKLLTGESLTAKIAGVGLWVVKHVPMMRAAMKVTMAQMLGEDAEEMMKRAPGMSAMMKVIIEDRNEAVYRDLEALVAAKPETKEIAIFYGAGHFATMQAELVKRGYVIDESADRWLTAIRASIKGSGLTRQTLEGMMKAMRQAGN